MNANNHEVVCCLRLVQVFSKKTEKSYPCVAVEFPDGTVCKLFDNRLLTTLLSSIYLGEKGGETK